jgi:hypothetical protein
VGRSQITIDDTGINLITKKINSNWVNTFDTSLNLNARDGISMFGQTVGISGGRSVNIGDSYGGAFDSSVGVVSVNGRDIDLKTLNTWDYTGLIGLNLLDLGFNMATVGLAKKGADPTYNKNSAKVKLAYVVIKKIGNIAFKIAKQIKKVKTAARAADVLIEAFGNPRVEGFGDHNDAYVAALGNAGKPDPRDPPAPAEGAGHEGREDNP